MAKLLSCFVQNKGGFPLPLVLIRNIFCDFFQAFGTRGEKHSVALTEIVFVQPGFFVTDAVPSASVPAKGVPLAVSAFFRMFC